jgi:hypothetical protein
MDTKLYPQNYTNDVLDIIKIISFDDNNVDIVGSMSRKSSLYSGDYDLIEEVDVSRFQTKKEGLHFIAKQLQTIVKNVLKKKDCFLADFKCGEIHDWKVINDPYNESNSKMKLDDLYKKSILSEEELSEAKSILVKNPTPAQLVSIKKIIRPELLRWTAKDIHKGSLTLRDNSSISLENAIDTHALCKLDVVAYVDGAYTDFSIIYIFIYKNTIINDTNIDPITSLKDDIHYNYVSGNYYKLAKRIYSLAQSEKNDSLLSSLTTLFNSDLGRLYIIVTNLTVIQFLLENDVLLSKEKIHYELEQTRKRLGNIYQTDNVNTLRVLNDILQLEKSKSMETLRNGIDALIEKFVNILNKETLYRLRRLKLIPLPDNLVNSRK